MTTVLIVDDHPVVRSGLRAVLESDTLKVLGEAANGEEAVALTKLLNPDVVLCDLRLAAGINGIETTAQLRKLDNPPAVLILTTFDRDAEIIGAIEAGAAGYLLKDAAPETISDAISLVSKGEIYLSPDLASRVFKGMQRPLPKFTDRETEVLQLIATGAANKEVAQALFVSEATVKTHLAHIFTKLDVDSRAKAIHIAKETGLI